MNKDLFCHLPPQTTIDTKVPRRCFSNPTERLVVSLLIYDKEGFLYLIEPKGAPASREWLIPAQEKVKRRVDHTFGTALQRCLREEIRQSCPVIFHPVELHRFVNHIPERHGHPAMTKYTIVFGGSVEVGVQFRPNPAEVREVVRICPSYLLDCLPSSRQEKFIGVLQAYQEALRIKLFPERPRREALAA